jgi:hypothetical protein
MPGAYPIEPLSFVSDRRNMIDSEVVLLVKRNSFLPTEPLHYQTYFFDQKRKEE